MDQSSERTASANRSTCEQWKKSTHKIMQPVPFLQEQLYFLHFGMSETPEHGRSTTTDDSVGIGESEPFLFQLVCLSVPISDGRQFVSATEGDCCQEWGTCNLHSCPLKITVQLEILHSISVPLRTLSLRDVVHSDKIESNILLSKFASCPLCTSIISLGVEERLRKAPTICCGTFVAHKQFAKHTTHAVCLA